MGGGGGGGGGRGVGLVATCWGDGRASMAGGMVGIRCGRNRLGSWSGKSCHWTFGNTAVVIKREPHRSGGTY